MIVRVAVEATVGDAATTRQRLAENTSHMRSALKELGLGDDQITGAHTVSTTRMGVRPNYESAAVAASGDGDGSDITSDPVTTYVNAAYNATPA